VCADHAKPLVPIAAGTVGQQGLVIFVEIAIGVGICPLGRDSHIDAFETPAPVIGELLANTGFKLDEFLGTVDEDLADWNEG
jgi:hypothetical protein